MAWSYIVLTLSAQQTVTYRYAKTIWELKLNQNSFEHSANDVKFQQKYWILMDLLCTKKLQFLKAYSSYLWILRHSTFELLNTSGHFVCQFIISAKLKFVAFKLCWFLLYWVWQTFRPIHFYCQCWWIEILFK